MRENPFLLVKKTRITSKDHFLTEEEAALLLKACPQRLRFLVALGLETGLRPGELLSPRRSYLHFKEGDSGIIRIPLEEEKTGKSRNLPMTEGARRILREVPANLTHPFVFSGPNNEPVTKNQLQWHFKKACHIAGIERLHTAHPAAHCGLLDGSERRFSLQGREMLGHSNSRTTERYAHLTPDHLADAKAALEQPVPKPLPPALKENRG